MRNEKSVWRSIVVGLVVALLGMILQALWPDLEVWWAFVFGNAVGHVVFEVISRVYK